MRIPDFHIHTNYSPDSSMQQTEAIEAAIKAGITDMCFTEHMDLGHHMDSFNRKPEFEGMYESIQKLRLLYPEVTVGYGVEGPGVQKRKGQGDCLQEVSGNSIRIRFRQCT